MTTETSQACERLTDDGCFTAVTRTIVSDPNPVIGTWVKDVQRTAYTPGQWSDDGTWMPTDLSDAPEFVRDFAAGYWTPERVDAFKAAHPYQAPLMALSAA